jgi:aminoglycoside 6-adenylyltransferase
MSAMTDDAFLSKIVGWATARSDITCLIMTGSRARPDASVDSYSDYDLEIFTDDPQRYTRTSNWMMEIADVWVFLATESRHGCPTRLIIFDGGRKVDFSILPISALEATVATQRLDDLYQQGYLALVDKHGLAARLPQPSYSPAAHRLPTEDEFRLTVEEFWFEAWHIPKYLSRGDLWVVKHRDWTMKELLLRMLEWRATAENCPGLDVGHIGLRMKEWTRPETWDRLREAFARFDGTDSRRALLATIALFRNVAIETAERLHYPYPRGVDDWISSYITEVLGSPE